MDSLSARQAGRPKVCMVARPHSVNRCGMREADQNIVLLLHSGFAVCEPLSTVEREPSDGNNVLRGVPFNVRGVRCHSRPDARWRSDGEARQPLALQYLSWEWQSGRAMTGTRHVPQCYVPQCYVPQCLPRRAETQVKGRREWSNRPHLWRLPSR
jgi:hypothetical protein